MVRVPVGACAFIHPVLLDKHIAFPLELFPQLPQYSVLQLPVGSILPRQVDNSIAKAFPNEDLTNPGFACFGCICIGESGVRALRKRWFHCDPQSTPEGLTPQDLFA